MKNVYIDKISKTGKSLAICMVIDSDIATGNAIIYNRETDKIETITLAEKHTLPIKSSLFPLKIKDFSIYYQ